MAARIGLVTYAKAPTLTEDDRPLLDNLSALGFSAAPVRWDDSQIRWSGFDALVLRSVWDYHVRHDEFDAWLATLERLGVPTYNSVPVVRWNMHKSYLRDLEAKGVAIPPTVWLNRGTPAVSLSRVMRDAGWDDVIVKPAVSASATDTWRVRIANAERDSAHVRALVARADVLVQRYVPEVSTVGEWSIVLIDGGFSHAVLKRPRGDDFRVQEEHGGSSTPAEPPKEVVAAALRIAGLIPGEWLFARIDGVTSGSEFVLMEAECIEPHLFFGFHPGARTRLAEALAARIQPG